MAEEHERPEIDSPEALEAWLADKPAEWAQVIAVRAALRVFPLLLIYATFRGRPFESVPRKEMLLWSFRSLYVSWVYLIYPSSRRRVERVGIGRQSVRSSFDGSEFSEAAVNAVAPAGYAYASAFSARACIGSSEPAESALSAVSKAFNAFMASSGGAARAQVFWRALNDDASILLSGGRSELTLSKSALWGGGKGDLGTYLAGILESGYSATSDFIASDAWEVEWNLIAEWYRGVLPFILNEEPRSIFGETADIAIATQPDEFWTITEERSAEDILEEIAEIADYRLPKAKRSDGETFPELIVSFLEELGRPASVTAIREYCTTFEPLPRDITIGWHLSELVQSGRIIRTAPGIYVHPKWHVEDAETAGRSEDGEAKLAHDVDEALQNLEAQAPAAYRFHWQENRLEAAPPADIASDPEGAQTLLDETRRKAESLAERLERSNADKRVLTSVQGLLSVLPENVADLRPALLRSRARSVEADAQAYSSPGDEEQFLYPDALAALIDLSETARDLQGYFPSLRELEAEITALAIEPSEVEAVKARLDEIVDEAAGHPEVMGASAVEALRTMEALATEPAPPAVRQKRIADYALVVRNSLSSVARVALDNAFSREAKQLASDVYAKARVKVVDGIAEGVGAMARPATIIAIGALIGGLFGPVVGIAAAAAGFGKVDRLLKLADKWLEKWEKEDASPDTAENEDDAKTGAEADDDTRGSAA